MSKSFNLAKSKNAVIVPVAKVENVDTNSILSP